MQICKHTECLINGVFRRMMERIILGTWTISRYSRYIGLYLLYCIVIIIVEMALETAFISVCVQFPGKDGTLDCKFLGTQSLILLLVG